MIRKSHDLRMMQIVGVSKARRHGYSSGKPPVQREGPKVGRNDPCPCGSGMKFKKCHWK